MGLAAGVDGARVLETSLRSTAGRGFGATLDSGGLQGFPLAGAHVAGPLHRGRP